MENQEELKVEYIDIEKIIPYDKNPRNNSPAVEACAASIRDYGFGQPISVDENMVIISGHTRRLAALKIGMEKIPCIVRRDLTPEQVRAYRVVDNKIAELSEWNEELLAQEIAALPEFNFADYGFDLSELTESDVMVDGLTDPDEVPETQEEAKSKRGEVYRCGEHRLMCADSTSAEDWRRLMREEKGMMVFTDPPYGVAIGDKNKVLNSVQPAGRCLENIANDNISTDALYGILVKAMTNVRENCAENASYYVSSPQGGELGLMMMKMMKDAGLQVRHILIWVKSTATFSLGRLDYDYRHEPIFYTWTKSHDFHGEYSTTVIDDTKPMEKMSKTELKELVHALQQKTETSVIYCDKPTKCNLHPTMKPVALVARFMRNSSHGGDIVLDAFGGSGTTVIAATQLKRKCRMMELDPHYCDVIRKRWAEFVHGEGCDWEALTPMVEPAPAGTEAKA
jgi:site-specific DNA-methyltransferase (adenine-specific)